MRESSQNKRTIERGLVARYQGIGLWLVFRNGDEAGRFVDRELAKGMTEVNVSMKRTEGVAECAFIFEDIMEVWDDRPYVAK